MTARTASTSAAPRATAPPVARAVPRTVPRAAPRAAETATKTSEAVFKTLLAHDAPHVLTTGDLRGRLRTGMGALPSTAALARWSRDLTRNGALQPVSRGVFLNRLAGPSVHAAEAAQYLRRGAVVSLAWVLERSGALNNYGDTVTCVVPQVIGMAPPKVGARVTPAAPFRFHALPLGVLNAGAKRLEDVQDLRFDYPRATPERALLDWIYLGASPRSHLPPPPADVNLIGMDQRRLTRLSHAMGIEEAWSAWLARARKS